MIRASAKRPAMCIVTTIPMPMNVFMGPHIRDLAKRFDITMVADGTESDLGNLLVAGVRFEPMRVRRKIAPIGDLLTLHKLWRLFRRERFAVVHSMMPKSGLLAMTAAALAGVPIRVHWFTGQVWATSEGAARRLLKAMDRLLSACATHLLADSGSQRDFLVAERIVRAERVTVLGNGSVCGVDVQRFRPNPLARAKVRNLLRIADSAVVALYVGRLNRDKGVRELAAAFAAAAARSACELHLLLVGPDEQEMRSHVRAKLADWPGQVHFIEYTDEPETYMASADFFVLPSHREGFGSTIIEAAACGLAAIATRIYGLTDAVVDGETGVLVEDHDSNSLTAAMLSLAEDRASRITLGIHAMERVHAQFRQEKLVSALREFYADAYPVQEETAHDSD